MRHAEAHAALLPWLLRSPLQSLALAEHWPRLLAVVAWVQAHPRPGVYLRQVDAPGVGALRLRLVATKGRDESMTLKGDDGKYAAGVLLDLDVWALCPR